MSVPCRVSQNEGPSRLLSSHVGRYPIVVHRQLAADCQPQRLPADGSAFGNAALCVICRCGSAAAMLFTDMRQDHHVTALALRRRPLLPGPEPAVCHPHQAAQTAAREIATLERVAAFPIQDTPAA